MTTLPPGDEPGVKAIPASRGAHAVADRAVGNWNAIQARLAPVIGEDGFRVLFARGLHRARIEHAWLAIDVVEDGIAFSKLKASLESQTPERAEAGDRALIAHFTELLDTLIGKALAARLLVRPATGKRPKRPRR
jgi:hypothetical protein